MPGSSWNSFFPSLQSESLTKVIFKKVNTDDLTITLENSSRLLRKELVHKTVSNIRLTTRREQLNHMKLMEGC